VLDIRNGAATPGNERRQRVRSSADWGAHAPLGRRRLTIAGAICLNFRLSFTARVLPW
jgi:hypothetical protein